MANLIGPKSKRSRRVGAKLFPKDEKVFVKKNFPPGMHGQGKRRISGYGTQLLEKQKAKWLYGILEKQFRKYYEKAAKKPGPTGTILIQMLEMRLDNIVYRLGIAQTRQQARQIVGHGFIAVNGQKVSAPSYEIKPGDAVEIRQEKRQTKYAQLLKPSLVKFKAPEWLDLNAEEMKGRVISIPTLEQTEQLVNPRLIIEYYSR